MTFGEKIRKLRIDKGLTQEEARKEIGIAISSLRNYENDKRLPDISQLKLIKRFYKVSYEYLLEDSHEAPNDKNIKLNNMSNKELSFLNKFMENFDIELFVSNMDSLLHTIELYKYINFFASLPYFHKFIINSMSKKDNKSAIELLMIFNDKMTTFTSICLDYQKETSDLYNRFYDILEDVQSNNISNIKHSFYWFSETILAFKEELSKKVKCIKYDILKMSDETLTELCFYLDVDIGMEPSVTLYRFKELNSFYKYIDNNQLLSQVFLILQDRNE